MVNGEVGNAIIYDSIVHLPAHGIAPALPVVGCSLCATAYFCRPSSVPDDVWFPVVIAEV